MKIKQFVFVWGKNNKIISDYVVKKEEITLWYFMHTGIGFLGKNILFTREWINYERSFSISDF